MNTISEIKNDIKLKNFSAVYLLMGEEEFFIDQITEVFIDNVLSKNEKEFNLNIIYGKMQVLIQLFQFVKNIR